MAKILLSSISEWTAVPLCCFRNYLKLHLSLFSDISSLWLFPRFPRINYSTSILLHQVPHPVFYWGLWLGRNFIKQTNQMQKRTSCTIDIKNSLVSSFQEQKPLPTVALCLYPGMHAPYIHTPASGSELRSWTSVSSRISKFCGKNFCPVWLLPNPDPSVCINSTSLTKVGVA